MCTEEVSYNERIFRALEKLPDSIAMPALKDITNRISDWLSAGGNADDPYIAQQVRYAENLAKNYKGA